MLIEGDEPIPSTAGPDEGPPGLEGLPRMDVGAIEASLPAFVENALGGPVVLTRHGADAFVMLPLDAYRTLWEQAPRPPVIDAVAEAAA